jgi:multicomponent Na+:H+ antiporter subunit D
MTPELLIAAALIVPAATALLIPLFSARPNFREAVTLAGALLLFAAVASLLPNVLSGMRPALAVLEVVPGLSIAFSVEPLGMLFALVASALWIVNSVYSIGYMRAEKAPRQTSFYVCFAVAIAATMGIAFSANLFSLFLFYELLTISTYPLVTHRGTDEARIGGRIYLLTLLGASTLLLLPAIAWTGVAAGTLDFTPGGILGGKLGTTALGLLLALYVFGIAKAAVMPVHFWLPAAMVAPTPVSALLHAVAVVKAGVFAILKIVVYVFGIDTLAASGSADWLVYVAGITIVAASLIALRQDNLKRLLAYSTVSQLSYVVLGAALLTPVAILGAALHIAAHAVSKITLFFAAGSIHVAAHVDTVGRIDGIGRRMPWTMGAFAVGALSMIGIPPTAGFLGKWFILMAAVSLGQWFAVGVIIVSTLLNAGYFLPIVYRAFARAGPGEPGRGHGEAPWPIVVSLVATAAMTVLLFVFPSAPYELAEMLSGVADIPSAVVPPSPAP